jgi:cobalt/nickel transport system ATP-binding protein
MKQEIIRLDQVSYRYPDGQTALNNISLSIDKGERIALLGPNGAGKSTLFQLFNGLLLPQGGRVHIAGLPVERPHLGMIRRKVGMVFQDPDDQLFNASVHREVAYGPINMQMPQEAMEESIRWALEVVGMSAHIDKSPFNLSGGEKKRLALASVLVMRPEILVLDEPTNALDPKGASDLVSLLNEINRDLGVTLVFASHDVDIVPLLADRVFLMNQGEILLSGSPAQVFNQTALLRSIDLRLPRVAYLAEILMRDGLIPSGELPLDIATARAMLSAALMHRETQP